MNDNHCYYANHRDLDENLNMNVNDVAETTVPFSDNISIFADSEAMEFNFHYIRYYSEMINDSVLKINMIYQGSLREFIVKNIQVNTMITGVRIFDRDNNDKFVRFVLAGKATSLYIHDGFAIID